MPDSGNGSQADIFLAGTAYLQIVSDVLNPSTFKADNPVPTVLHVEPGLWMRVPGSGSPSQAATIIQTTILNVAATQAEPSAQDVGSGIVSIPFWDGTGPTPGTTMNAAVVQFA